MADGVNVEPDAVDDNVLASISEEMLQRDGVPRQPITLMHMPQVDARYVDLTSPNKPDPFVYVKIPFSVYTKVLKHMEYMKHKDPEKNVVKGGWSKEEDDKLMELVHLMGAKGWNQIAQHLPGRLGKQCRERYINHLDPTVCKDKWTNEEDRSIIQAFKHYGPQWSKIAKLLPRTRTANATKNHWNSSLKKVYSDLLANEAIEDAAGKGPILPPPVSPMLGSGQNQWPLNFPPGMPPFSTLPTSLHSSLPAGMGTPNLHHMNNWVLQSLGPNAPAGGRMPPSFSAMQHMLPMSMAGAQSMFTQSDAPMDPSVLQACAQQSGDDPSKMPSYNSYMAMQGMVMPDDPQQSGGSVPMGDLSTQPAHPHSQQDRDEGGAPMGGLYDGVPQGDAMSMPSISYLQSMGLPSIGHMAAMPMGAMGSMGMSTSPAEGPVPVMGMNFRHLTDGMPPMDSMPNMSNGPPMQSESMPPHDVPNAMANMPMSNMSMGTPMANGSPELNDEEPSAKKPRLDEDVGQPQLVAT